MPYEEVQKRGFLEYGTVTSRPRRVGTFDFELAKEAVRINHPSALAITFLDRIDPECTGKTYEQLSKDARAFLDKVEETCEVPVTLIGTGSNTMDIIDLRMTKG
jgi:adenylosuccinate synthase